MKKFLVVFLACLAAIVLYEVANAAYVQHQEKQALKQWKQDSDKLDACMAAVDKKYSWTDNRSVTEKEKCWNQFS